ncbi:MAG: hypothetical protein IPH91_03135 [Elusimicrobia bacterium]|nr:hypothetical protein [Elusimicrobiota bacterium]
MKYLIPMFGFDHLCQRIWQEASAVFSHPFFLWMVLGILLVLFIIWIIRRKRISSQRDLLSYRLKVEIERILRYRETGKLRAFFENLYFPSWPSFFPILGVVLLFLVLANISCITVKLPFPVDYQNLIAAHAGVGTIIFALLIFIAESLRDDENKDRARVLLRESFLFPITVACILVFFLLVGRSVNLWNFLPVVMVAIGTISGLWRILAILLNKTKFNQKRARFFKDRIQQSIDLAFQERIGNNLLAKELGEGKIQLRLNFFSLDEIEEYHCFWLQGPGAIADIDLGKLRHFADEVEREANKKGFSFIKDKVQPAGVSRDDSVSQPTKTKTYQQCDRRFLLVKYREELSLTSRPRFEYEQGDSKTAQVEALAIDKKLLSDNPEVIDWLNALTREIFIIKREGNFSEELKLELSNLKDQFMVAIEEKRIGKIGDELFKMYVSFAEAFLERLNAYGGGYSHKQAREERTAIMGGWTEVRWLYDGVREIYLKAVDTQNQQIISEVIYLPIAIAARAIDWGDQYVYQEFIKFPSFLYWLGLKQEKPDVREFMVHRSWTYLREMADFYIESRLRRKERSPQFIPVFKDFAIPVLAVFQELLKTAFDKNQTGHFREMLKELNGLFRHFNPEHDHPDASEIRRSLDFIRDENEKEKAKGRLALQEEREKASAEIRSKRQEVIFGLSAWILEQCHQRRGEAPKEFFDLIAPHLPTDLVKLTDLFMTIRDFEVEDFWGWDNWEMPEAGEVYHVDFHSKLDRLYCVKALQILSNMPDDKIKKTVLSPSRGIAFLAEDRERTLLSALDAISKDLGSWSFVLSSSAGERIDALKALLVAAKQSQEDKEREFIRAAEIDPGKRDEFKNDFLSELNKTGKLRKLVKISGAFEDHTQTLDEKAFRLGFKQISQKEAFIKEWHVHFSNWGEQFGSGMSRGEDLLVFESLLEKMNDKRSISISALISEIEVVIRDKKLLNPIILQTLEFRLMCDHIDRSDLYVPRYRAEADKHQYAQVPGFVGFFKILGFEVPVIDLQATEERLANKVIVTDLKMVGIWKQYCPLDPSESPELKEGMFVMQVADLNSNNLQRAQLLKENPSWLQEHFDDKEGFLRQNVLINIRQKIAFEITDPSAGTSISVSDNAPNN